MPDGFPEPLPGAGWRGPGPKCKACRGPAVVLLPSHNAGFCASCFDRHVLRAVEKGLQKAPTAPWDLVAVAVSGGKDSLAAWDVLDRMGRRTVGVHLDLGLGAFSGASREAVERFAGQRGLALEIGELKELFGHTIPELSGRTPYEDCAVCGALKRHYLNMLAIRAGAGVLATGHHLDDEAARLLGNLMRRRKRHLDKFAPHLPSGHPAQAARIKPLYRVDEDEIRLYCRIRGIRPAGGDGCHLARGATSAWFKDALGMLERNMPGTKRDFLFGHLRDLPPVAVEPCRTCVVCGQPTSGDRCAACRIRSRLRTAG